MLAIWSLVPLPFLKPASTSEVLGSHIAEVWLGEFWALKRTVGKAKKGINREKYNRFNKIKRKRENKKRKEEARKKKKKKASQNCKTQHRGTSL